MLNPWMVPLTMTSANVIALRTWMMVPLEGRQTDWQRREAARMVDEKVEAVREAQAEALALAWKMCFTPWAVWGPLAGRSLPQAMASATDSMVRPFNRRAVGNAKRLQARAMQPALAAWTALPAFALAAPDAAAVIPISRGRRRRAA
ncbi:MAG: hypothetical protein EHM87_16220 [Burkholderiales bacterium]|nr:MAG: hypothetical protein EHM87_16220 [Burkholderiales bacterium]